MPSSPLFLTADLGTSSTKVILWDMARRAVAEGRAAYPTRERRLGWSELDPDAVYRGFVEAVRACVKASKVSPKNIVSVSFSSAMHCLTGVDDRGRALFPIQTWADNRSAGQADFFKSQARYRDLPARTGCPFHSSYPLSKIRWLAENRPALHARVRLYVSLKSYVMGRWLGIWVEDWSMASGTALLDMRKRTWLPRALSAAKVSGRRLPGLVSPYATVARLSKAAAELVGLAEGTAIIPAAGDGPLANLGGGKTGPGDLHLSLGTSAALRTITRRPVDAPARGLWCYVLDEKHWVVGGASNNGAYLNMWFLSRLKDTGAHSDQADALLMKGGLKPTGLLFYPYLRGERSLQWNSHLRGALLGMENSHTGLDILQAGMEGVAFHLQTMAGAVRRAAGAGKRKTPIVCSGGGLGWKSFGHLLANVFGEPMLVHRVLDTSARGACIMAQKALGYLPRLESAKDASALYGKVAPAASRLPYYRAVGALRRKFAQSVEQTVVALDTLDKQFEKE